MTDNEGAIITVPWHWNHRTVPPPRAFFFFFDALLDFEKSIAQQGVIDTCDVPF